MLCYFWLNVKHFTDDILKARQKLRQAESESDIATDLEKDRQKKRIRKPSRRVLYSSSEEDYENEGPTLYGSSQKVNLPEPPQIFSEIAATCSNGE